MERAFTLSWNGTSIRRLYVAALHRRGEGALRYTTQPSRFLTAGLLCIWVDWFPSVRPAEPSSFPNPRERAAPVPRALGR